MPGSRSARPPASLDPDLAGWGGALSIRSPHRRARTAAFVLVTLFLFSTVAQAFTPGTGFSASIYATGVAPGTAVAGSAFIGSTVYVVDPADSGLYAASGTSTLTRLATITGGPTGIAALGGALYISRAAAGDVVRVDPATLAVTTVVPPTAIACPAAIAADTATGDLFVASCDWIYRVQSPATTPLVTRYARLSQDVTLAEPLYGITVGQDGTLYVVAPNVGQVWRVQSPATAVGTPTKGVVAAVTGARGVTAAGWYLLITAADGSVQKLPLPQAGGGPMLTALSGGDAGDLASTGPDGCAYVAQGATLVRVANANGTCDLANAGPTQPAALTLTRTSSTAVVAGLDEAFIAVLANVPNAAGVSVTFTVSGANATATSSPTGPNGIATFVYTPQNTGSDTIVATASVGGTTLTSKAISLTYDHVVDRSPPKISYVVTGSPGATFGCPRTDIGTPGRTEYCGWYVTTPTIHWIVTPQGTSGISADTSCPDYTLTGSSGLLGTPVTCQAFNGDRIASSQLQVRLQATVTPPTVRAVATLGDGSAYVEGTPVVGPVRVSFVCDTAVGADGIVACTTPSTVSAEGTTVVSGSVVDIAGTVRSTTFRVVIVAPRIRPTALTFTSPELVATPGAVAARLVTDAGTPVADRVVTFSSGALVTSAVTNGDGIAAATLALPPGPTTINASFAGDASFAASSADQQATAYAHTRFVVWGANAATVPASLPLGARVQFYGPDWAKQISDRQLRGRLDDFKGLATSATTSSFTAVPGVREGAPRTPQYIGVLVTTRLAKTRGVVEGNVVAVVVLRVDDRQRGDGDRSDRDESAARRFGVVLGLAP